MIAFTRIVISTKLLYPLLFSVTVFSIALFLVPPELICSPPFTYSVAISAPLPKKAPFPAAAILFSNLEKQCLLSLTIMFTTA